MHRITILLPLLLCLFCTGLSAQTPSPHDIKPGNPIRKTLLDVVRKPTVAELGQNVEFVVSTMRVKGNWAFVYGQLQQPGGQALDHSKFKDKGYREMSEGGIFDNNFQAVLQKQKGKWVIVKRALGCTDVCWLEWLDLKGAPKEIFPNG